MDTTPPPADTLSTSISNNSNENIGEVENKDTEMSHLEQDPSNCNNMNINKRARQNSGQRNPHAMSNIIHRNPEYGIVGANTVEIPIIRDHRMSVSDSGDSEPPRPSDLETEQATTAVEKNIPPSGSNVPETLESDGDVRSDEEVKYNVNGGIFDFKETVFTVLLNLFTFYCRMKIAQSHKVLTVTSMTITASMTTTSTLIYHVIDSVITVVLETEGSLTIMKTQNILHMNV